MKKLFLTISLSLFGLGLFAQDDENFFWSLICVISDEDNYTNVRKGCSKTSSIIGKTDRNEIFWNGGECNDMKEIWYNPNYQELDGFRKPTDNNGGVGYMHKSRAMPLIKLDKLPEWREAEDGLEIENESITVTFKIKKFSEENHTIGRHPEENWVETIDGEYPWGIDGWLPHTEIASISVLNKQNQEIYHLPQSAIKNLYEPTLSKGHTGVFAGKNGELYIVMINSDGAGAYVVGWTLVDMKLKTMNLIIPF